MTFDSPIFYVASYNAVDYRIKTLVTSAPLRLM